MRHFIATLITIHDEHELVKIAAETTTSVDSFLRDYCNIHDYEDYVFEQVNLDTFNEADIDELKIDDLE